MPSGITIIGLGPGDSRHWTRAAYAHLQEAAEVYVRTGRHPSVTDIPAKTISFDEPVRSNDMVQPIRAQSASITSAVDGIAAEIVRLGQREQGVSYAVPGHPDLGEATVPRIRALAAAQQLPVTIIPGLSFIEPALTALQLDGADKLQIADAAEIGRLHHPPFEPDRPVLITNLLDQELATEVQRTLLNAYPAQFRLRLVQAAGATAERIWSCPLSELDRQPQLDQLTTLYLPPAANLSSFSAFQETVAHLRAPDGCPWDRAQTHLSLRSYLLEETYEVLETLDANDPAAMAEELGDLLLQIALHTQIAIDEGEFKMGDVIDHINRKLWRRHPHVFGDVKVNGVDEVLTNWEAIKLAEKAGKSTNSDRADQPFTSALDGIPDALPALAQALAISQRAVRVGFEWPNIQGVLDKLVEEAHEITEASDQAHLESEIGDWLFSAVNLARWRNIDPESALRATNARFVRRFKKIEALAAAQGKSLPEMSIEEMDTLWDEAKREEA
jgi:tetrapyrrole methylase family protein/MazG family protein